eukprot:TRINITY_DN20220_c0_g1_i1.p1 TRINITY_DN20220_c0_g1~~TRINITY_DN20220_c0_g1_i1.p1  ORF type:complete len:509 (+),score=77.66 TRINITY_DN20220_c0_g1_i1:39-1529(+)
MAPVFAVATAPAVQSRETGGGRNTKEGHEDLERRQPETDSVFKLRDFAASPASGCQQGVCWIQTMGQITLQFPFGDGLPMSATEQEFLVELSSLGLRVSYFSVVPASSQQIVIDELLSDEVVVSSSWWSVEAVESLGFGNALVVRLIKAKSRSWQTPFLIAATADLQKSVMSSSCQGETVSLRPGRPRGIEVTHRVSASEIIKNVSVSQTDEFLIIRMILQQSALDEASQDGPLSRMFSLDAVEGMIKISLRDEKTEPLLSRKLGGRILVEETDWSLMKVTDDDGKLTACPALSIQLRKAEGFRNMWERCLLSNDDGFKDILEKLPGTQALDDVGADFGVGVLLPLGNDEVGAQRFVDDVAEIKRRGDECFRTQQWEKAIALYSLALQHAPEHEKLLCNRSAAYMEVRSYRHALKDATEARRVSPAWPKALFRQGVALRALRRYDMAISAFYEGKSIDTINPSWQREIDDTENEKALVAAGVRRSVGAGGEGSCRA